MFTLSKEKANAYLVLDNFYDDPDGVRAFALEQKYQAAKPYFPGMRTKIQFFSPDLHAKLQEVLGQKFVWQAHPKNGCFQVTYQDDLKDSYVHHDSTMWAGVLYLNPDHDDEPGTSFYCHKRTGRHQADDGFLDMFQKDRLDIDEWEMTFTVPFRYNRLVLYPAKQFHKNATSWGTNINTGRLTQVFFV